MRVLDLFCCEGGASAGYVAAGHSVTGVDCVPRGNYPFEFIHEDALDFLGNQWRNYDFIHASPPCQGFSNTKKLNGYVHDDLIAPTRRLLQEIGKPYVIENVVGAPLINPTLLCGSMFDIRTYRHRIFEASFSLQAPVHPEHLARTAQMGRPVSDDEYMHIVGSFSGVDLARKIMGMPWASQRGLSQAIPPCYTEFIAREYVWQEQWPW